MLLDERQYILKNEASRRTRVENDRRSHVGRHTSTNEGSIHARLAHQQKSISILQFCLKFQERVRPSHTNLHSVSSMTPQCSSSHKAFPLTKEDTL